ncbi:sodium:proline symporter [Flavobacterium sp. Sd200]|uniref:sensor histidine kinase n=1 Tax=Flavobacterium sp. Sd200 TaxID=2692211 RepID=UPI00136CD44B|nr:sensor histidine kinase [Flavobacterium sp. Sd200]MXN90461.1 sodium:proline symporter [Flavobacterium sp. Sd200]
MNSIVLLLILAVYLGLLFFVAHWAEKKGNSKWTNNPYVYSLSLAVYCSAWTYYGSIGVAANSGLNYLPTYIGPIIGIPAWIFILVRIIRISRINKVSSIADFISLRYGNSRFLGAIVSVVCLLGILPYIALQLKAISETFHVVAKTSQASAFFSDTTTYVAIALALFSSYYGTRYVDASEKRKGIVTAVAMESLLKLFFFLLVGLYVTFFVFDGFDDIYTQASAIESFAEKNTIGGIPQAINWFLLCVLSLFAIFLLPRQFQMSVIENHRESHVRTALWLFPLYLLLINIFVYPIAWGGNIIFEGKFVNADTYSLLIPQLMGNQFITVLVFLGGFSAAISMIVVACIGLSTMLSNNILIPYGYLGTLQSVNPEQNTRRIVNIRRIGIFSLIIIAYLLYRMVVLDYNLVSIGLVSFVIIAQLAPAFFGAILWRRGSRLGAIWGITMGFAVCTFTLLIPYATGASHMGSSFISNGLFGIDMLKPFELFGLDYLDPIPHALFWSMFANIFTFLVVSVTFRGNYRERNYAEMFIDIDKYITMHENAFIWKGTAYTSEIQNVLNRFLGEERTARALNIFHAKYDVDRNQNIADARLIKFAENLLTGHIGTASARILISSVVKEDKITLPELLNILEESKENIIINKKLTDTSNKLKVTTKELQRANEKLVFKDRQKDEFLDTVTHELRTPITAIKAASEILYEDDEIPEGLRKQFLQNIISESDRLNRLIDKILDLERFETGKQRMNATVNNLDTTMEKALEPLQQLIKNKGITIHQIKCGTVNAFYDEDRIIQVITNLVSNAIKFCPEQNGSIFITINADDRDIITTVNDNGKGIDPDDLETIFDKFYQSNNQNIKKPVGSGLGLAISRQIIEYHKGRIWAQNRESGGASLIFTLPIHN